MRVLITGASGFVGRLVTAELARMGEEVHAACRSPVNTPNVTWHPCDLLDFSATSNLVRQIQPQSIVHLAWNVEHGRFWTSPENLRWVGASLNLAKAANDAGVKYFLGIGTCVEYAPPDNDDCVEDQTLLRPQTLYGVAKDATRSVLEEYFKLNEIAFAWARLFFLYGPGEHPDRLVPSVARALIRGEAAKCTKGLAVRDFMDVRDAAAAISALVNRQASGLINVAHGTPVTIAEIARHLGQIAGRPDLVQLGALPDRKGEAPRITASTGKLKRLSGFQPAVSLQAGLEDAFQYWQRHKQTGASA